MAKRKHSQKDGDSVQPADQPLAKRPKNANDAAKEKVLTSPATPFVPNPVGDDRIREAYLYEYLSSEDASEREKAAAAVVISLWDVPEEVLVRHLDNRLFRGLASGRKGSRIGFSLVATELLRQLFGERNRVADYSGLSFDRVLDYLVEKTRPVGNIPGQEERDCYLGQLFGLQCFVEARILFGEDKTRWERVLGLILRLAAKKVWLKPQCGWAIVQALQQMDEKLAVETLRKLSEAGMGRSPEGVAMWLVAIDTFPGIQMPEKPWQNPLASKDLDGLKDALKEKKSPEEEGPKMKQGVRTAQLHFVWDVILAHYLKLAGKSDKGHGQQFSVFWSMVVDDALFSKSATDFQKFTGFALFEKMIQQGSLEPLILENLFTKNLMVCLMNQAANKDRFVHLPATKALKTLQQIAKAHPSTLPTILKNLLGKRGAYNFKDRTGQDTIVNLLQHAGPVAPEVLSNLQKPLMKLEKSDVETTKKYLRAYATYLSKLATVVPLSLSSSSSGGKKTKETSAGSTVLKELATFAYSNVDHPAIKQALTPAIREVFRTHLEKVLSIVLKRSSNSLFLCDAMQSVKADAVEMEASLSSEKDKALKAMRKLLKGEKKASKKKQGVLQGLALLYAVTLSQLYAQEPDAFDLLQDLDSLFEKINDKSRKEDQDDGLATFLVESLMCLLPRKSALMREACVKVFEGFTGMMDIEALQVLTDTLFAEENDKGYRALFEAGGEDEEVGSEPCSDGEDSDGSSSEDVDGDDDGIEVDSDVEFIGLEDASDVEVVDGEDGDDDEEDDDDEDGGPKNTTTSTVNPDTLAKLDDALGKLLNSHTLDKDAEHADSASDSDMSDSEMMALDAKLSEVFRQRLGPRANAGDDKASKKTSAQQKKENKEAVVLFKRRVLDLLETFLKTQPLSPLAFELLAPLLAVMRATTTKVVGTRAGAIAENFFKWFKKARKDLPGEGGKQGLAAILDGTQLRETLVAVHTEAGKGESHAFARAASKASLAVATAVVMLEGPGGMGFVEGVYETTKEGGGKLKKEFWMEFGNWKTGWSG